MKERPILFSGPMVRAILDGRKTQTRRLVKPQPDEDGLSKLSDGPWSNTDGVDYNCPYGIPGDRLWVRETHAIVPRTAYARSTGVEQTLRPDDDHDAAIYRAGWDRSPPGRWRPSIHMPRWASRIELLVTGVRVERLKEIGAADARAEGHPQREAELSQEVHDDAALDWFEDLWLAINGAGSWDANPWVWVVEFERLEPA